MDFYVDFKLDSSAHNAYFSTFVIYAFAYKSSFNQNLYSAMTIDIMWLNPLFCKESTKKELLRWMTMLLVIISYSYGIELAVSYSEET